MIRLWTLVWSLMLGLSVCLYAIAVPAVYLRLASPPPTVRDALVAHGFGIQQYAFYMSALQGAFGLACFAAAASVAWHLPTRPFARLVSLLLALLAAANPPNLGAVVEVYSAAAPLAKFAQVLFPMALIAFIFLFPDGTFVPTWTRRPLWLLLIALPVAAVAMPGSVDEPSDLQAVLIVAGFLGGCAVMVYRYAFRSGPVERQQTKWVVVGGATAITIQILAVLLAPILPSPVPTELRATPYDPTSVTVSTLAFLLLPISISVAMLRYRLWEVDVLINRTLVYAALTVGLLAVYASVVAIVGATIPTQSSGVGPLIATVLVAICVRPLHARIQHAVNRLLYGDRDDPYLALTRLGAQLEHTLAPEAVLPTIARSISEALRVPHAALAVRGSDGLVLRAMTGTSTEPLLRLPLVYQNDTVGELSLSARAPGERFSPADRRLLEALARQAGVAAHAVLLAADLERSRLRLVVAREEARRRLGSDLHDGLGHRLAGFLRSTETLSNLVERDPDGAAVALRELAQQARAAIREVRDLAHRLHPPELELLGLAGALRERAAGYASLSGDGLHVSVETPAELPRLPVAVESAVYYVAQEALTNVERHARASHCRVRLALVPATTEGGVELFGATSVLELEVADDGRGLQSSEGGLGIASMRERAAELRGSCCVGPAAGGGARVYVRLPCVPE